VGQLLSRVGAYSTISTSRPTYGPRLVRHSRDWISTPVTALHHWPLKRIIQNKHTADNCNLLRYYARSSGNSLSTFWHNLPVPFWPLKMG